MSDIIDRFMAVYPEHHKFNYERLRAENEKLRAALKPFADVADEHLCESDTGQIWDAEIASHITFDALRAAAAAYKETGDEKSA